MKRYNQIDLMKLNPIYTLLVLLGSMTCLEIFSSDTSTLNALRVLRTIAVNNPGGGKPIPSKIPKNIPAPTPTGITPPSAPIQPLAPVTVTQTQSLANFGTTTPITLDYQVEQLPVTAQIATLSMVASFGSIVSPSFTFDADTLAALNAHLAKGNAVVVLVSATEVNGNIVAFATLLEESDMTKSFGAALQSPPAGATLSAFSGGTITYQLATETQANTITVTADKNLFILNPTVSLVSPLSDISVQATFGTSEQPVVSAEINFDVPTIAAIQAALTVGDIVTFDVIADYMFGLGDIVVTAVNVTKETTIGNTANLAITPAQEQAGNFIAYVVNLSMTGEAGKASYVRGINQDLQLELPATATTSVDFYVPADLSVAVSEGENFPNVTLNGIFSDGSSSAGFVFDAQDLTQLTQALQRGDNVSVIVQQSSNGATLMASAVNLHQMQIIATATNQVTPAQAKETLTGFALAYQLSGQTKPTVLHAKYGQSVTFGTSVYFTMPIDPATFAQTNVMNTRGYVLNNNTTAPLTFAATDITAIQTALTAGHPVVIGTGYASELSKMVMQAYDNQTKKVIAQVEQVSNTAAQEPLFGFVFDYMPAQGANGQPVAQPATILVPSGNVLTLVPVTMTAPAATAVATSILSCVLRNQPLQSIEVQGIFSNSTTSDWVGLSRRDVQNIQQSLQNNTQVLFVSTYQNNYFILAVWDMSKQVMLASVAIPVSQGTFTGFNLAYNYAQDTTFDVANTIAVPAGKSLTLLTVQSVHLQSPNAAQALILPSATTPVTQLWFSPVFQTGFSELALQGAAPQLMTAINSTLAQGIPVMFAHDVVPTMFSKTVQGVDLVVTAYNESELKASGPGQAEMFTFVFPLIGNSSGPVQQNNQWTSTNITYQFGTTASQILGGLSPQNATFTIGDAGAASSTALVALLAKLEGQYPGITALYTGQTPYAIALTQVPNSWDSYFSYAGYNGGFTGWATYEDLSGIQPITAAQWQQGVFALPVMLGGNNQLIADATTIGDNGNDALCVIIVATADLQIITALNSTDNTLSANSSQVRFDINGTQYWFEYGQPAIMTLNS